MLNEQLQAMVYEWMSPDKGKVLITRRTSNPALTEVTRLRYHETHTTLEDSLYITPNEPNIQLFVMVIEPYLLVRLKAVVWKIEEGWYVNCNNKWFYGHLDPYVALVQALNDKQFEEALQWEQT